MYSRVLGSPNHQFSDPMILRVVEFTTQTPLLSWTGEIRRRLLRRDQWYLSGEKVVEKCCIFSGMYVVSGLIFMN